MLSAERVICFLVNALIYYEMKKCLAQIAETRLSGWPLFLAKTLFPHFQQASLPRVCSRGNVVSVDVTRSWQDFRSLGVPFQGDTLEMKSSKAFANRHFTSEVVTFLDKLFTWKVANTLC